MRRKRALLQSSSNRRSGPYLSFPCWRRPLWLRSRPGQEGARREGEPARQIAENSGTDGSILVGKLLESKDTNYGYDAQKGEFTDMIKAGILDPTKVVRHDAASVAGLIVTTEAMVAEKPEPKPAMPPSGGMGGMDF
jgi:chaperonin GroEL